MKKCKINIIVIIFISLFLIGIASSQTYKLNSAIDLKIPTNSSSCYVTITFPDSTNAVYNASMSVLGTGYANYSFSNSSLNGDYNYFSPCGSGTFQVTPNGDTLTTGKAMLYSFIWIVSFLMLLGLLIYGLATDGNNKRDEFTGYILDVSNAKYLKIFSLALCYVISIFLSYFTWMICYSYLSMDFMSSIFQVLFYGLAIATLPLFVIFCYLLIANKIRDSKIIEELSRGLRVK